MNTRAKGYVTISGITLADGSLLTTQQAVDYGWIKAAPGRSPAGWGLEHHEIPVGPNLFLDNGRQLVAYTFGNRSTVSDYAVGKFGVGTGTTAARVTDTQLEAPITLSSGQTVKAIDYVDFTSPFVARVVFTLGINDANGYAITEMGLYSGNSTLMARVIRAVTINKSSDFAPTLTWRISF